MLRTFRYAEIKLLSGFTLSKCVRHYLRFNVVFPQRPESLLGKFNLLPPPFYIPFFAFLRLHWLRDLSATEAARFLQRLRILKSLFLLLFFILTQETEYQK